MIVSDHCMTDVEAEGYEAWFESVVDIGRKGIPEGWWTHTEGMCSLNF